MKFNFFKSASKDIKIDQRLTGIMLKIKQLNQRSEN